MLMLYMTEGCHLCEQAQTEIIRALGEPAHEVDIADDSALLERYEVRIPVLRRADGEELGWPFDRDAVREFVNREGVHEPRT